MLMGLLEDCFQSHDAYTQAIEHRRFLVIGRKGSGKTAIFRKIIRTRAHDVFAFGHAFTDYPWHHHDAQATIGVPEEDRYTHSWKYLMLLTASKVLLNQDQSQPWCDEAYSDIAKLENFVVDSYGSRNPDVTQLFVPTRKLRINPTLGIPGTNFKVGINVESVPISELPRIVQDVNRTVAASVIRALNPDHNYYIAFDQLDLGFDPSDPKYSQRLTGLILAARDINQLARDAEKKMSVSIFLRDDIYQLLRFEDKNKLTENYTSLLEWDRPGSSWTLKRLMEERFCATLDIPSEGSWDKVFNETQEMPGRQKKYHHIRDRTFRRPRDVIKFCNEVLSAHKAQHNTSQFENNNIVDARKNYSQYLLSELEDEIFKHVAGHENLMELLKAIGTLQFTLESFSDTCSGRPGLLPNGFDTNSALKQLFEFSVVGYLKSGGGGGGSQYVWKYLDPRARFDDRASSFRVHPGFKEVLGLKRGGGGDDGDE